MSRMPLALLAAPRAISTVLMLMSVAAWVAACSSETPLAPTSVPRSPDLGATVSAVVPRPSPVASAPRTGATRDRQDIEMPANILAPSACLGGTFHITGMATGWRQLVVTPGGLRHINEYFDFSQLTATLNGDVWTAEPGSVELWTINLPPPGSSDSPRVVVHEGRTRFVSSTGAPNVRFVHRIHRLVLPGGELQFNEMTFEAECYGATP